VLVLQAGGKNSFPTRYTKCSSIHCDNNLQALGSTQKVQEQKKSSQRKKQG